MYRFLSTRDSISPTMINQRLTVVEPQGRTAHPEAPSKRILRELAECNSSIVLNNYSQMVEQFPKQAGKLLKYAIRYAQRCSGGHLVSFEYKPILIEAFLQLAGRPDKFMRFQRMLDVLTTTLRQQRNEKELSDALQEYFSRIEESVKLWRNRCYDDYYEHITMTHAEVRKVSEDWLSYAWQCIEYCCKQLIQDSLAASRLRQFMRKFRTKFGEPERTEWKSLFDQEELWASPDKKHSVGRSERPGFGFTSRQNGHFPRPAFSQSDSEGRGPSSKKVSIFAAPAVAKARAEQTRPSMPFRSNSPAFFREDTRSSQAGFASDNFQQQNYVRILTSEPPKSTLQEWSILSPDFIIGKYQELSQNDFSTAAKRLLSYCLKHVQSAHNGFIPSAYLAVLQCHVLRLAYNPASLLKLDRALDMVDQSDFASRKFEARLLRMIEQFFDVVWQNLFAARQKLEHQKALLSRSDAEETENEERQSVGEWHRYARLCFDLWQRRLGGEKNPAAGRCIDRLILKFDRRFGVPKYSKPWERVYGSDSSKELQRLQQLKANPVPFHRRGNSVCSEQDEFEVVAGSGLSSGEKRQADFAYGDYRSVMVDSGYVSEGGRHVRASQRMDPVAMREPPRQSAGLQPQPLFGPPLFGNRGSCDVRNAGLGAVRRNSWSQAGADNGCAVLPPRFQKSQQPPHPFPSNGFRGRSSSRRRSRSVRRFATVVVTSKMEQMTIAGQREAAGAEAKKRVTFVDEVPGFSQITQTELLPCSEYRGKLSAMESPSLFWCQFDTCMASTEIQDILNSANLVESPSLELELVKIGTFCAAPDPDFGKSPPRFFRGRIDHVEASSEVGEPAMVSLLLIDYGCGITVLATELKALPSINDNILFYTPWQAHLCSLANFAPVNSESWTPAEVAAFREALCCVTVDRSQTIESKELQITVEYTENGVNAVSLRVVSTDAAEVDFDVADYLAMNDFGRIFCEDSENGNDDSEALNYFPLQ